MSKTLIRIFSITISMFVATTLFAADSGSEKFNDFKEYLKKTQQFISYEWSKSPAWNPELKSPTVDAKVMIDPKGNILSYEFTSESSDATFNTACETFMKKLGSLPTPPEYQWHRIMEEGLLFRFTPNLLKFKVREIEDRIGCPTEKEYLKNGYRYLTYYNTHDKAYVERAGKQIAKSAELYRGDFKRVWKQLTGRERAVYAIFELVVAQDGKVKQANLVCPSSAPVYGERILNNLKDLEKIDPPPADTLNKDNELLLLWSSFHYIKK